jgi:DNA-binding transcriptional ArsR family regulator
VQTAVESSLVAKLFSRFSDPSRLAILISLRGGPLNVGEIVETTGLSQPNVSNHLHCLHCCGIVRRAQDGRRVFYELADERICELLDMASELLSEVAVGVAECTRYGS